MGRGRRPVIDVSWDDAIQFVEWLTAKSGKRYRLLTEAEWEYAARAGATTEYFWGDGVGRGNANCDGCGSQWDFEQTAPVASFKPNAFGLHDMHGNVWEWVEDPWHDNFEGSLSDGSTWVKDGDLSRRVLRGGSWYFTPDILRSAFRSRHPSVTRNNLIGFRVGRTLDP